jgi:hypothetical protein
MGIAALAAGSALGAEPGGFAVRNAGDLASLCSGGPGGGERTAALNFCHGYAQGVVALELQHEKRAFCIPNPSPSRTQTMNEFVTWARSNPTRLSGSASEAVVAFFRERFPCKG